MAKHTLIITVKTKPGRRADLRAAWERHLRERVEASDAQEPWFAEYMREAAPLLAGPPELARAEPVWAKGLTV